MAFTTWAVEYARAKDALANNTWDAYFISSVENRAQMRTSYTRLGNITAFIDWLREKAEEESLGTDGAMTFIIGGG